MSYLPSAQVAIGSGYTANADNGSKSAVIPSSATLTTVATALNIVVAGAGDALKAMGDKVKALETDAANRIFPNA